MPVQRENAGLGAGTTSGASTGASGGAVGALLGPTNPGKTHQAIGRMLEHRSGMIGLPLPGAGVGTPGPVASATGAPTAEATGAPTAAATAVATRGKAFLPWANRP